MNVITWFDSSFRVRVGRTRAYLLRQGLRLAFLAALATTPSQHGAVAVPCDLVGLHATTRTGGATGPRECVGTVVERGTGKAIAGAGVEARFVATDAEGIAAGRVLAVENYTTDHEGRYTLQTPAELAARSDFCVTLDVHHPDYASRRTYYWAREIQSHRQTETPSLERIELYPGVKTGGRLETPDGRPAVGVRVGGCWTAETNEQNLCASPSSSFETVTDREGRFSVVLPKTGASSLWFLPEQLAPAEHVIQDKRGDLGIFRLEQGMAVKGRVLDLAGQPVANVPVEVYNTRIVRVPGACASTSVIRRAVLSDPQGQFAVQPLPAGSYNVHVTRSYDDPATHERRYYRLPAVFYSAPLVLKEGLEPTPVVLQAVPHVTITVQYVDGQGRPTAGLDMSVHAWRSQMEPRFFKVQGTTTWWTLTFAELGQGTWGTSVKPDREGKAIVQVPKGGNVQFTLVTNERRAIKYRSGKDAPAWPAWDGYRIDLGRVDADTPDFLICCYAAPRVVVSVYGQDGRKLSGVKVTGAYRGSTWAYPDGNNQLRFDDLPGEGQYCSRSMLPDEEVTITATADGCAPQKTTVSLYEGEDREIELVLGKP